MIEDGAYFMPLQIKKAVYTTTQLCLERLISSNKLARIENPAPECRIFLLCY